MSAVNTNRQGASFELAVAHDLVSAGWWATRVSASKGGCDVIALSPDEVLLVECKLHGRLDAEQWNDLYDLAMRCGAVPVLAFREYRKTRIHYRRLMGLKNRPGRPQPYDVFDPLLDREER